MIKIKNEIYDGCVHYEENDFQCNLVENHFYDPDKSLEK